MTHLKSDPLTPAQLAQVLREISDCLSSADQYSDFGIALRKRASKLESTLDGRECRRCKGVRFIVGLGLQEGQHGHFRETGLPIDCPDCIGLFVPASPQPMAPAAPDSSRSMGWDAETWLLDRYPGRDDWYRFSEAIDIAQAAYAAGRQRAEGKK